MSEKILRHVVFFQFTADTPPEDIQQCGDEFMGMPAKISAIHDLEWGANISDGQYTHCLHVMFRSVADLKIYAEHPDHTAIGAKFRHRFASVTEIDYWAEVK